MNYEALKYLSLYHGHQFLPGTVLHGLHEHLAAPFEKPEYRRFPGCPASALAAHPPCPEVGLVGLELPAVHGHLIQEFREYFSRIALQ